MPDIGRRTFLGLIGTAVVAAATPEWFPAQSHIGPAVPTVIPDAVCLTDLVITARKAGTFIVRRIDGDVLFSIPLAKDNTFRWIAPLGQAIRCPQGIASLVIEGPEHDHWGIWEHEGERMKVTMAGSLSMPVAHPTRVTMLRSID